MPLRPSPRHLSTTISTPPPPQPTLSLQKLLPPRNSHLPQQSASSLPRSSRSRARSLSFRRSLHEEDQGTEEDHLRVRIKDRTERLGKSSRGMITLLREEEEVKQVKLSLREEGPSSEEERARTSTTSRTSIFLSPLSDQPSTSFSHLRNLPSLPTNLLHPSDLLLFLPQPQPPPDSPSTPILLRQRSTSTSTPTLDLRRREGTGTNLRLFSRVRRARTGER